MRTPLRVAATPSRDDARFLAVLTEALGALDRGGLAYGLIGGVASAALGRPRWTNDVDVFVAPQEARRCLELLRGAGFATDETDPEWIFKATKQDVQIDVIFRAKREIYFDDEVAARCAIADFRGVRVRTVAPEDLIVIKAVIHDEHTPRHWHDALGVIAERDLDWDYLLRRARHGARRVLSLLVYAQADDLIVPDHVIRSLFEAAFQEAPA